MSEDALLAEYGLFPMAVLRQIRSSFTCRRMRCTDPLRKMAGIFMRQPRTSIVAFSVLDICDQIPGYQLLPRVIIRKLLLKCIEDDIDDLNVLLLVMSSDIISLKQPALLLYHVDRL